MVSETFDHFSLHFLISVLSYWCHWKWVVVLDPGSHGQRKISFVHVCCRTYGRKVKKPFFNVLKVRLSGYCAFVCMLYLLMLFGTLCWLLLKKYLSWLTAMCLLSCWLISQFVKFSNFHWHETHIDLYIIPTFIAQLNWRFWSSVLRCLWPLSQSLNRYVQSILKS